MTSLNRRAALAGLLLATGAIVAGCQTSRSTSTSDMSPDDLSFVTDAFNIIEFDRQECTLAQTQSKDPEIRMLATDLLQQANDFDMQLRPIAASAGIKPPTVLRSNLRVRSARLRLGQGREFDRAFVEDQIVSHQDAINSQEMMMQTPGTSPQIRELSQRGLGIIQANLTRLQALQMKMMMGSGTRRS